MEIILYIIIITYGFIPLKIYTFEDLKCRFFLIYKYKSKDYKLSAVKYYLNNDISLDDICLIFDCLKQSL